MTLLWLFVQLVGYCAAFLAVVAVALFLILAPPFVVGRAIWRRYA